MSRPAAALVELAMVGFVFLFGGSAVADASRSTPSLSLDVPRAAPGDVVVVRFDGWPNGPVSVGVCGNTALRGTQDCDLTGDEALTISATGSNAVELRLTAPPVPCPCVIRAASASSDVVATTPIDLVGMTSGPPILPDGPAPASQLRARAHVVDRHETLIETASPAFAGPDARALVVTLANRGTSTLRNLRVVSTVGRQHGDATPIGTRTLGTLAPGSVRTLRIPFELGAPTYGDYVVHGSVYGLATPATFAASTSADPWALELLLPIGLIVIAEVLRKRDRDERRARDAAAAAATAAVPVDAPYASVQLDEFFMAPEPTETAWSGEEEPTIVGVSQGSAT
jgi:hypothetical protein